MQQAMVRLIACRASIMTFAFPWHVTSPQAVETIPLTFYKALLRSEIPSGMRAKLRTVAASNSRDHPRNLFYCCLLALHMWWCYSSRTSRSWWITQSTQHHRRGSNNIPSFLLRTTSIARSSCEGWTLYDLHILVTAPFCSDRKSRAARAQSFAPLQQATVVIILAISLTVACSRYTYDGVILHAHPVRDELHINATPPERLQQLQRSGTGSLWKLSHL